MRAPKADLNDQAADIIAALLDAYKEVADVQARHPEDGTNEGERFFGYEEYDETLNVALESLRDCVAGLLDDYTEDDGEEPAQAPERCCVDVIMDIENEGYSVRLDPESGEILKVYDRDGMEIDYENRDDRLSFLLAEYARLK